MSTFTYPGYLESGLNMSVQVDASDGISSIFNDGYVGMKWLKNVFCLLRDYWDATLSTPYSGQLFPPGSGTGGPGQIYPY